MLLMTKDKISEVGPGAGGRYTKTKMKLFTLSTVFIINLESYFKSALHGERFLSERHSTNPF